MSAGKSDLMTRAKRSRAVLAAAAALVVTGGAAAVPAMAASTGVPQCSSAHLSLAFLDKQAAMGHRFIDYSFTNVGKVACRLRGYPAALLLSRYGAVNLATWATVAQWPLSPVRTVQIAPGQQAFFTFHWTPGAFCPGREFKFYGLRLAPPQVATGFPWRLGYTVACDGSAMVSAVRPQTFPF